MINDVEQQIKEKFMGRILKIEVKNGRIFEGKLVSIDFRSNIILHDTVAEIPPEQNCPLNYKLYNSCDKKLKYNPSKSNMTYEQKQKQKYQYIGTHYYFGSVMILGEDIKKIYMKKKKQKDIQLINQQSSTTMTQN